MDILKNIKHEPVDNFLFLQGVFKNDYTDIEDVFKNTLLTPEKNYEDKNYDKIPVVFTSLETWIKTTNLCCWYCSRNFKGRPWFEPQNIEPAIENSNGVINYIKSNEEKKKITIMTMGVFCSPNCVRAYIETYTINMAEKLNKISMLLYLYEIFNNRQIPDVQPSPKPTEMIQYGGSLTSNDYQKKIESLDLTYLKELGKIQRNDLY